MVDPLPWKTKRGRDGPKWTDWDDESRESQVCAPELHGPTCDRQGNRRGSFLDSRNAGSTPQTLWRTARDGTIFCKTSGMGQAPSGLLNAFLQFLNRFCCSFFAIPPISCWSPMKFAVLIEISAHQHSVSKKTFFNIQLSFFIDLLDACIFTVTLKFCYHFSVKWNLWSIFIKNTISFKQ